MIYKVLDDNKQFQSFHIDMEEFLDVMDDAIGEVTAMQFSQNNVELSPYWEPLKITYVQNEDCGDAIPDIGIWHGASLILSEKAMNVLRPMIESYGEILPATCEGKPHFIFNCRTLVDADEAQSKRIMSEGYFMSVESLVFPASMEANLFKTPFENNQSIFCDDELKDAVETNGLGGVYFGADLTAFM
jgi:hypothetical protein